MASKKRKSSSSPKNARKKSGKKAARSGTKTVRSDAKIVAKKVRRAMHKMKEGTLKSGRGGQTVTNPKQAIAIGISEARKLGAKVPKPR